MRTGGQQQCILVAAVCGHDRLNEKLGEREAAHALERCRNRMEHVTSGFQGRIVRAAGDETAIVFDDAHDALQAACEMQRRVDHLPPVSGIKIAARMGCHAGAAQRDNELSAEGLQLAARVARFARPGQILATAQTIEALPQAARQAARPGPLLDLGSACATAFEVVWRDGNDEAGRAVFACQEPLPYQAARLSVRYAGRVWLLDSERVLLALGRDVGNDLHVADRRASRHHARIERRGGTFVVVDQSTNGTYVSIEGEDEVLLKREEFVLRGCGRISFGHSCGDGDTESVGFEVLS